LNKNRAQAAPILSAGAAIRKHQWSRDDTHTAISTGHMLMNLADRR